MDYKCSIKLNKLKTTKTSAVLCLKIRARYILTNTPWILCIEFSISFTCIEFPVLRDQRQWNLLMHSARTKAFIKRPFSPFHHGNGKMHARSGEIQFVCNFARQPALKNCRIRSKKMTGHVSPACVVRKTAAPQQERFLEGTVCTTLCVCHVPVVSKYGTIR